MLAYVLKVDHDAMIKEYEAKTEDYDAKFKAMQEAIDSLNGKLHCPNDPTKTTLRESAFRLSLEDTNFSSELMWQHGGSAAAGTTSAPAPAPLDINHSLTRLPFQLDSR
jgi:hypothetical protein